LNVIEHALAEYLSSASNEDRELSAELQAIPLYRGWTGTTYLTIAGEFLFRDEENNPPSVRRETDEALEVLSLVVGAQRHPILANLLPKRDLAHPVCDHCDGSGHIWPQNTTASLYCGECHGLGWPGQLMRPLIARELGSPDVPYPPFDDAMSRFTAFAATQGVSGRLVFISCKDAFFVRRKLVVRVPEQETARQRAKQTYADASRRRLGVAISAAATLPGPTLAISVYAPRDPEEAERLMFNDGLKLSIPQTLRPATAIGAITTFLLRKLFGRLSFAQSAEEG
jgi:hypothetical protein